MTDTWLWLALLSIHLSYKRDMKVDWVGTACNSFTRCWQQARYRWAVILSALTYPRHAMIMQSGQIRRISGESEHTESLRNPHLLTASTVLKLIPAKPPCLCALRQSLSMCQIPCAASAQRRRWTTLTLSGNFLDRRNRQAWLSGLRTSLSSVCKQFRLGLS